MIPATRVDVIAWSLILASVLSWDDLGLWVTVPPALLGVVMLGVQAYMEAKKEKTDD